MKVGYARVSKQEQKEGRQIKAFVDLGIEKVFLDKLSGKDTHRQGLQDMLAFVREGDSVTVESFSRFARSTKDLLNITEELTKKGVEFISLKESIDTHTPAGKFMLTVFAALAEFEREQMLLRQKEGIAVALAEGKVFGRPRVEVDQSAFVSECKRWRAGDQTAVETMRRLNMKPNSFYRRVKELGI
ncbi:MAG: recombinase family protein [Christensenellaceae bacterium]|nr:recombinase family protein [Christensenellaceae bacterium]